MNNGVIVAETNKMGPVDSSAQAEGMASSKCAEILENVREIACGMGMGILSDDRPWRMCIMVRILCMHTHHVCYAPMYVHVHWHAPSA